MQKIPITLLIQLSDISMALHTQFCCWIVRKKLKEMFLQSNLQLLKHDFNLQHINK